MKITVDRATFADALKYVQQVAGQRVTLPVLAGVLIETGTDTVTLSATDLEVGVRVTIPARIGSTGRVLLPSKLIGKYVSKDTSADVVIMDEQDGARATIHGTGPVSGTFRTMPVEDFPKLPDPADKVAPVDVDVVATVATVASTDEARPVLTGVKFDDGTVACTDSYRLASARYGAKRHPLNGALVPARVALKFLPKLTGVTGGADTGHATFRGTLENGPAKARRVCDVVVLTRTIEGSFPNHDRLWPEEDGSEIVVGDASVWVKSIQQMRTVITHENTPLTIEANGSVTLKMGSQETAELSAAVPGNVTGGGEVGIALNPAFAAASLGLVGDNVRLNVRDALKPAVFTGDGPVSVLIMPMRVS